MEHNNRWEMNQEIAPSYLEFTLMIKINNQLFNHVLCMKDKMVRIKSVHFFLIPSHAEIRCSFLNELIK